MIAGACCTAEQSGRRHAAARRSVAATTIILSILLLPEAVQAQPVEEPTAAEDTPDTRDVAADVPEKVDVAPLAGDDEISQRLGRILEATQWFEEAEVRVEEGVVFLTGRTWRAEYREWAGNLARNTQDVVAVVNRLRVVEGPWWDLTPAWSELRAMGRDAVLTAPLFGLAVLLLILTWYVARLSVGAAARVFERRMSNRLLRQVAARAVAVPVFLVGVYLILRVAGLTQIAATVVGGTGLVGLVIGIAFRDIAENFLASLLISTQRPFAVNDLIEVEGWQGFVQRVTTRGTVLMMLDGNHVQIPNATIYKATIKNLTANPRVRQDFTVGIGYDDSVTRAQETALKVLQAHAAVLDDPESLVLVEMLGASAVNLRIYFWIDGKQHSLLKVRSSVIRQIKAAFVQAGISMPDEAREVVFPREVPVRMLTEPLTSGNGQRPGQKQTPTAKDGSHAEPAPDDQCLSTAAEGDLASESEQILRQAQTSRMPVEGENLLEDAPAPKVAD